MPNKSYMSIFAEFENDKQAEEWFKDNILPHVYPKGGPVFSYSFEDESKYRDLYEATK